MRKLIVAGASLIISGILAGNAIAADMPVKAPVYVAPFSWTGIYLGINAGYGTGTDTGDRYCTNPVGVVGGAPCTASMPAALSASGAFVGGQLGANYQTGMFVWGVESDIQVAHINDSTGAVAVPCCAPGFGGAPWTLTRSQNLDWFGTVRGRLGVAFWDRALIYGTGGLMYAEEVVGSTVVSPGGGITTTANSSSIHTGWVAGGGLEYAFTNKLSAKIEGLYYNIGSETVSFTNPVTHFTNSTNYSYSGALVRLGANLKFGP
jgi:outer membrane immunogenic protein